MFYYFYRIKNSKQEDKDTQDGELQ